MIIEHLTFSVPLALRPAFLALDAEIWTATLARQHGFLGKEVWTDTGAPDTFHLIIRWTDRDAWKAVPADLLAETDQRFAAALGVQIPVLSCIEHRVLG
ncbi:MAG: TIGR03792 family protein [Tabrizicola sp.]|jgi:uncharacterized protein (TIGR03792 family)|nr:TIGR03792 family protein [Tabrizicola sp.]